MRIRVEIDRRPGLSDPQGTTVHRALRDLGYDEVEAVHFGKSIVLEIDGDDADTAVARVREMCERLLANPVMEDFIILVEDGS